MATDVVDLQPGGRTLIDRLPAAVLVVDRDGTILAANERLGTAVGVASDEMVGRGVGLVSTDVADVVAGLGDGPIRSAGRLVGPATVRCDLDGSLRRARLGLYAAPAELGVEASVVTLVPAWADEVLDVALAAVDGDPDGVLDAVAESVRGTPLDAVGAVLLPDRSGPDGDRLRRAIGSFPLDDDRIGDLAMPWHRTFVSGERLDVGIAGPERVGRVDVVPPGSPVASSGTSSPPILPADVAAELLSRAVAGVWIRPVVGRRRRIEAVLAVFRGSPAPASRDQAVRVAEAARIAGLAFDRQAASSTPPSAAMPTTSPAPAVSSAPAAGASPAPAAVRSRVPVAVRGHPPEGDGATRLARQATVPEQARGGS